MSKSKIQNWDDVDIYTTITFSNDDITVIFKIKGLYLLYCI